MPLLPLKLLSPESIARFAVVALPWKFPGDPEVKKLFVTVGHYAEQMMMIKATSKTERYTTDGDMMHSCVFYEAGQVSCFSVDTVIQPDNLYPIGYPRLKEHHEDGSLSIWESVLPADFEEKLRTAIRNHVRMSLMQKRRVLTVLDSWSEAATR